MPTAPIYERLGQSQSSICRRGALGLFRAARPSALLLACGAFLCSGLALWAQTSDSQADSADKSWTVTSESQSDNVNPTRTLQSHTQTGNRTVDNQSVQRRGPDGRFEPYQDVEKTTVKVDASTVRTTTRTFGRDADGAKTLVQVTEEEAHTLPGGNSTVVSTTSNPDANGRLQLVQRQIEETKTISKDVEEKRTTVMLPSINGDLAAAMKTQERRERSANDTVVSQKTTLLPDGAGNWQVGEIHQTTTRQDGQTRTTEERISRPDSEGKLGEISRTVSKESENTPGEKRDTVETYSVDLPGSPRDGSLHLVDRTTTAQTTGSTGQQTTVRRKEQPDPGDPGSGLRVSVLTTDTVRPDSSGAHATQTIELRDANGDLQVVSVDTSKSDNTNAVTVQIAPAPKPAAAQKVQDKTESKPPNQ
jgi:hypothetical protein